MRLPEEQATFLKQGLQEIEPKSQVYLFGSRAGEHAKGGDVDILWLTVQKIPMSRLRRLRVAFFKKFGWQKLDLVNFTFDASDPFKQIALQHPRLL